VCKDAKWPSGAFVSPRLPAGRHRQSSRPCRNPVDLAPMVSVVPTAPFRPPRGVILGAGLVVLRNDGDCGARRGPPRTRGCAPRGPESCPHGGELPASSALDGEPRLYRPRPAAALPSIDINMGFPGAHVRPGRQSGLRRWMRDLDHRPLSFDRLPTIAAVSRAGNAEDAAGVGTIAAANAPSFARARAKTGLV